MNGVLFWTTLLGVIDELYHYLYLTADYSGYFDFNDVMINFLGAAAGALVYYGFRSLPDRGARGARFLPIVGAVLSLLVGVLPAAGRLAVDPPGKSSPCGIGKDQAGRALLYLQREPDIYGSQRPARDGGTHYGATPVEGELAILLGGLVFATFGARARIHRCARSRILVRTAKVDSR